MYARLLTDDPLQVVFIKKADIYTNESQTETHRERETENEQDSRREREKETETVRETETERQGLCDIVQVHNICCGWLVDIYTSESQTETRERETENDQETETAFTCRSIIV